MLFSNNLSITPSLVCVVLYLYLHACYARPLVMAMNKETVAQIQLSKKDSRILVADERFVTQGSFNDDKISDGMQLPNDQKASAVEEALGDRTKTDSNLKVSEDTGHELKKRSTLESPPCNSNSSEETVNNSKENDTSAEDIQVTDYAQPHRKPPIHNRGT